MPDSPDLVSRSETETEGKPTLREIYLALVDLEKRQPDPNEKIKTDNGYSPRSELVTAGYALNNVLGGGEKPIIKAVIDEVDYGTKRLISTQELVALQHHQKQQPDRYGWQGFDPDEVRQDMISFLFSARPRPDILGTPNHTLSWAHNLIMGEKGNWPNYTATEEDQFSANVYFWYLREGVETRTPEGRKAYAKFMQDFVNSTMPDIYPWQSQPHPLIGEAFRDNLRVSTMPSRRLTLVNQPSPFLDSGFYFPKGGDLTIRTPDNNTFRMNLAVFHLASRNLSEMGDGGKHSYDQHYLTIGEYIDHVFIKDPEKRATEHLHEEAVWQAASTDGWNVIVKMADRFICLARDWITTPEAKKYLSDWESQAE